MKRHSLILLLLLSSMAFSQQSKKVTICWDVSLSMQDRDTFREFYFLDAYFQTAKQAEVTLLTFSDKVLSKDSFTISNGNWEALKQKLSGLSYDGATSFQNLGNYAGEGEVLLFTDGYQNAGTGSPQFKGELFIINGKKEFDRASLNLLAIVNNGNLVNLPERSDLDNQNTRGKSYSGVVYEGTTGVQNALVYIKGNVDEKAYTDEGGSFSINGVVGDTLVISNKGKVSEFPLDENRNLNFSLSDGRVQLEEVILEGEKIEVPENYEVTTGFGKENPDKIGYAVQSITEDDISAVSTSGNRAIQGKFSGVQLGQNDDLSQVTMRPSNSILGNNYGLIVIDGVPIERSNSFTGKIASTDFIDPQNIAEVTVLKGLSATNRFGSMGANGVLLITTKTSQVAGGTADKPDLARLKNNVYDEKIKVNNKTLVTPYLKELKNGKTLKEAYDIYLKQRESYKDVPEYLLDVFEFFYDSSPEIAKRILSNILEKKDPSYEALRGMFLKCSEKENYELALLAAHKKLDLFPNKIQSYLDMALAERNSGNYQEALNMLNGMITGKINPKVNFNKAEKVIGTEIRNLINLKRNQLDFSEVDSNYHNNLTYNARVVLDWNNPDAEFVVQFVNPQKRFFNWGHTEVSDRNRILDELRHGFSNEQFEIVGAETKGDWLLNVTYLGNRSSAKKTPTFLKCRVQYNFGRSNQSEEEFLVRLHEVEEVYELAKFSVN
ncbi:TonB-dependent receptor plug domain-containing protein [Muricauda sp. JGD-17]|uniref:TonB-dependent receptor plug domain-containing protein n=1 Tax=Flagellimonas ochracea TaxID=2696472 RepID=A0A964TA90_9FLAO|nr:TonB-dependent receptor plug domain-containing protein [Allomuricauda ochracea]NAY91137.1 TonB-dependent receptor plug domain-containing protein [Allomuricauda ochracea]